MQYQKGNCVIKSHVDFRTLGILMTAGLKDAMALGAGVLY